MTNDSIKLIVRNAIAGLQKGLNKNFSLLSTSMSELLSKVETATSKIDEAAASINDHSNRIATIEGTLSKLDVNNLSGKCINEKQDRLSHSNNLILFGFKEDDPNMSNINSQANSHSGSQTLLSNNIHVNCKFSPPDFLTNIRSFRIGLSVQTQSRPRPVKIICSSMESAKTLHRSFINAKKKEKFQQLLQGMRISWDMTKSQQEELSLLKGEMESRKKAGETNIRIAYKNGVPCVVAAALRQ